MPTLVTSGCLVLSSETNRSYCPLRREFFITLNLLSTAFPCPRALGLSGMPGLEFPHLHLHFVDFWFAPFTCSFRACILKFCSLVHVAPSCLLTSQTAFRCEGAAATLATCPLPLQTNQFPLKRLIFIPPFPYASFLVPLQPIPLFLLFAPFCCVGCIFI